MSTQDQRKRLKAHYQACQKVWKLRVDRNYRGPSIPAPPMPDDLTDLRCSAMTKAGTPCKQKTIYSNGRCKWHGGCSTGPKTEEGKKRSAMNGHCPKQKRSHTTTENTSFDRKAP